MKKRRVKKDGREKEKKEGRNERRKEARRGMVIQLFTNSIVLINQNQGVYGHHYHVAVGLQDLPPSGRAL